ncbi:MAG: MBG domain-containing protein [Candidatus Pseudobacter hemicellulosilyticus]|uniref:MBG domain-containing protein n=1 Tax=Candidatus Pseudobacter hemicellulosilyticus TaxID=3121375 RepID=A0AAJ5WSY4_9BACT|nr:MAG: MBG domain-containing protein [Pseudobacter sp.]
MKKLKLAFTLVMALCCLLLNSQAQNLPSPTKVTPLAPPPTLTLTTSKTDIYCNGGSNGAASVQVTGGVAPYTYSWSPSGGIGYQATGLVAGTYTVTVKDANSEEKTATVTVQQPPPINVTPSQTNVSCGGGSNATATVTASGGTGTLTYSWSPFGGISPTATGLPAGTYFCTITDANYCQKTEKFIITEPAVLKTTGTQTNVTCNSGSNGLATVTPSGGSAPYTYSWSPSGGNAATASGLPVGVYTVTVTDANSCTAMRPFTITQPPAISTTGTQTNIVCNGASTGIATVTASGGTTPYTYSWDKSSSKSNSATGLAAGEYTVTVTDANGCFATRKFTVTQPPAMTATTSQVNVYCNGGSNGSASVTVSGGSGPYTYSWSPSGGTAATATGLAAGHYTVTITDANLCSITRSFDLTQPTAMKVTPSQTNVSCNGGTNGTASVTVSGGSGPYTYSWSPTGGTAATATGLAVGSYTVTITDANLCSTTQNFTISQPPAMSAVTSQQNVSCNGASTGSATVTASGGAGSYTYSWAPSGGTAATASGLAVGSYTCTITDANACYITRNFTITQPTAMSASMSQVNIACNGASTGMASVHVTGGAGSYTYSWSPSGGTAATATGLAAGPYTVTVTDANNCQMTRNFSITQPPPMSVTGSQTEVTATGMSNGSATVTVTGGTGSYTYSWSPSGGTAATATGLAAGIYTVTITDANLCSTTKTFNLLLPATLGNFSVAAKNYGDAAFTLTAPTSNSSGTFTYTSSNTAVASISGSTVTILQAGTTTITAQQATAGSYAGATTSSTLTVSPKTVTVIMQQTPANTKTYDGSKAVTLGAANYSLNGVVGNDAVNASGTATFDNKDAGTGKTINIQHLVLSGASKDNYTLAATTTTTTGTIKPKAITPTYGIVSKTYDGGIAATVVFDALSSTHGILSGDAVEVQYSSASYETKNVGVSIPVTVDGLQTAGLSKDNYQFSGLAVSGKITQRDITVQADAHQQKTYGDENPVFTYTVTEGTLAAGDGFTGELARVGGESVGDNYEIGINDLSAGKNYHIYYVPANFSIVPKAITVTADADQKKVYGEEEPVLTYSITSGGSLVGNDHFTGQLKRAPGETLGSYAMAQSNLSAGANYTLTFVPADFAITARDITVTAASGKTKVYGEQDPALTYSITAGNLVGDDVLTGKIARITGENAGVYSINQGTLTGGDNYALTYVPADFEITKKPISITAKAYSKVYGAADPTFTFTVNTELVSGDSFTGALGRENGKNVGEYTINIGTLTAGNNYTVAAFEPAKLTITPAPLLIIAEDKTRPQGTANPAFTFRYEGLVAGDAGSDLTVQPQATTTAINASPIGYYSIVPAGAASGNYTITYENGQLTVQPGGNTQIKGWASSPTTIQIRINTEVAQNSVITLFTDQGQPIRSINKQLAPGINSATMNIGHVAPGVYILHVKGDKFKETQRIKIK